MSRGLRRRRCGRRRGVRDRGDRDGVYSPRGGHARCRSLPRRTDDESPRARPFVGRRAGARRRRRGNDLGRSRLRLFGRRVGRARLRRRRRSRRRIGRPCRSGLRRRRRRSRARHDRRGRRRGRRRRRRSGCGCGVGSGRGRARREVRERVDVALLLCGDADAEVHVRAGDLRLAGRSDRADLLALSDRSALRDRQRPEMRQRDCEPVRRLDREAEPRRRNRARERDGPGRRCAHGPAGRSADVDAAMLARGVRVRRIEDEGLEHRAIGRPGPCVRCRRDEQRQENREHGNAAMHIHHPFSTAIEGAPPTVSGRRGACSYQDSPCGGTGVPTVGRGRGRCQTGFHSCHKVPR